MKIKQIVHVLSIVFFLFINQSILFAQSDVDLLGIKVGRMAHPAAKIVPARVKAAKVVSAKIVPQKNKKNKPIAKPTKKPAPKKTSTKQDPKAAFAAARNKAQSEILKNPTQGAQDFIIAATNYLKAGANISIMELITWFNVDIYDRVAPQAKKVYGELVSSIKKSHAHVSFVSTVSEQKFKQPRITTHPGGVTISDKFPLFGVPAEVDIYIDVNQGWTKSYAKYRKNPKNKLEPLIGVIFIFKGNFNFTFKGLFGDLFKSFDTTFSIIEPMIILSNWDGKNWPNRGPDHFMNTPSGVSLSYITKFKGVTGKFLSWLTGGAIGKNRSRFNFKFGSLTNPAELLGGFTWQVATMLPEQGIRISKGWRILDLGLKIGYATGVKSKNDPTAKLKKGPVFALKIVSEIDGIKNSAPLELRIDGSVSAAPEKFDAGLSITGAQKKPWAPGQIKMKQPVFTLQDIVGSVDIGLGDGKWGATFGIAGKMGLGKRVFDAAVSFDPEVPEMTAMTAGGTELCISDLFDIPALKKFLPSGAQGKDFLCATANPPAKEFRITWAPAGASIGPHIYIEQGIFIKDMRIQIVPGLSGAGGFGIDWEKGIFLDLDFTNTLGPKMVAAAKSDVAKKKADAKKAFDSANSACQKYVQNNPKLCKDWPGNVCKQVVNQSACASAAKWTCDTWGTVCDKYVKKGCDWAVHKTCLYGCFGISTCKKACDRALSRSCKTVCDATHQVCKSGQCCDYAGAVCKVFQQGACPALDNAGKAYNWYIGLESKIAQGLDVKKVSIHGSLLDLFSQKGIAIGFDVVFAGKEYKLNGTVTPEQLLDPVAPFTGLFGLIFKFP